MAKGKASPKGKDDSNEKTIARNRRASHEYEILDKLECGIVLVGSEVKSLRAGKASLEEAYARIQHDELWLINCDIAEYPQANMFNHDPRRPRKLLLHKRELRKFAAAADHDGLTMIPLSMYFSNGKAKVQIAVGKGRKLHDKRQKMKETEANKEIRRAMSKRMG